MAEKGGTKILITITICVMLITIGLSGCIEDDNSNDEEQNQDTQKKDKLCIWIRFVELNKLYNNSNLYEIKWEVRNIPCDLNHICNPGDKTILHYSIDNGSNWKKIDIIPNGECGEYSHIWNTTGLPRISYCMISIWVLNSRIGLMERLTIPDLDISE